MRRKNKHFGLIINGTVASVTIYAASFIFGPNSLFNLASLFCFIAVFIGTVLFIADSPLDWSTKTDDDDDYDTRSFKEKFEDNIIKATFDDSNIHPIITNKPKTVIKTIVKPSSALNALEQLKQTR